MNFTSELKGIEDATAILEKAQEQVAKRFVIEVKKMLAKYKKYNYSFSCGNGTFFFSKNDEIVHDEGKLPKDMQELCTFLEEQYYIQQYISHITLGESNES